MKYTSRCELQFKLFEKVSCTEHSHSTSAERQQNKRQMSGIPQSKGNLLLLLTNANEYHQSFLKKPHLDLHLNAEIPETKREPEMVEGDREGTPGPWKGTGRKKSQE